MKPPGGIAQRGWLVGAIWPVLTILVVAVLLYLAVQAAPLEKTWEVMRFLKGWHILALAGLNAVILILMALRWGWILGTLHSGRVHWPALLSYRLVGFGVSFFTPGPQFGGEPVQVDLLRRREDVPLSAALSSVYLDRLLDVLANFTFLALGVSVSMLSGLLPGEMAGWAWGGAVVIVALPLGHIGALFTGRRPASWLARRIADWRSGSDQQGKESFWERAWAVTREVEQRIATLCHDQPRNLFFWIGLSALIWLVMLLEYGLTLRFLGITPSLVEVITAITAARLALLMPVPGGLGALEASQVFATQALGWGAQVGMALSLVIRARDLTLALFGLGWGVVVYHHNFWVKWR